jgi:hypothetical protein
MSPLRTENKDKLYLGALIDVMEMIGNEADKQYTGEFSSKIIFTENLGFRSIQRDQQFEAKFELYRQNKQEISNNILADKAGYLLHNHCGSSIIHP